VKISIALVSDLLRRNSTNFTVKRLTFAYFPESNGAMSKPNTHLSSKPSSRPTEGLPTTEYPVSEDQFRTIKVDFKTVSATERIRVPEAEGCPVLKLAEMIEMRCPGFSSGALYPVGAVCHLRCPPDFQIEGSAVRICQANNTWSGRDVSCFSKSSKLSHIPSGCQRFTCQAPLTFLPLTSVSSASLFEGRFFYCFLPSFYAQESLRSLN